LLRPLSPAACRAEDGAASTKERLTMPIDLSTITSNQIFWFVLVIIAVIVAFVVVRFFWRHIFKYLVQGCLVIVVIAAVLAILHYFKVI